MMGLYPSSRARAEKSASSPYTKKCSSRPPSSSHTTRGVRSRQPVTIPTSRTESRLHEPIDSGSSKRLRGNAVDNPVAKQKTLQSVGRFQHDDGSTSPSSRNVRPP